MSLRASTSALTILACLALVLVDPGCKRGGKDGSEQPQDGGLAFTLPKELRPPRDAVDLCPERAACSEALPGWVERCRAEGAEAGEIGEACFVAGFMTRIVAGPAYQGDAEALTTEILALHDRACDHGQADGCAWAASLRLFRSAPGEAGQAERARSLDCADERRGRGAGPACGTPARAVLYRAQTAEAGEATLIALCEQRELAQACGDLAYLYVGGKLLRESVNDALRFAERGCALKGGSSCAALATIVHRFDSLADLQPTALDAAGYACERGYADACATAAVLYDNTRGTIPGWDDAHVLDILERGCAELEGPASCVLLGMLHEAGLGEVLPVDYQRAAELHQWACEHGDDEGCLRFGVVMSNARDPKQAEFGRRLVVELCQEGYGPACALLPPELR
ncbi:MAG: sel1 repeat family protein [Myxococcales bacterium]|nr:sel1 repeat family protein [Myxococcales bacterium]